MSNANLNGICAHSPKCQDWQTHNLFWDKAEQRKRKRSDFITLLEHIKVNQNWIDKLLYLFDDAHRPTICEGFEHITDTRPFCSACGANRDISDKSLEERNKRWKNE